MSESHEEVLHKLDALFKKHADAAPDIPVLTELVDTTDLHLDDIPVLTEEVPPLNPASVLHAPDIELDLVPEPIRADPLLRQAETAQMLARLAAVEAEVQADVEARIAKFQAPPSPSPRIEIPQNAAYVVLPASPPVEPPAPRSAPEPGFDSKQIADFIQIEVRRALKTSLHSLLAEELDGMLNSALDKAVSSMLEQFMVHMEDVVRATIVSELSKQLATLRGSLPPPAS